MFTRRVRLLSCYSASRRQSLLASSAAGEYNPSREPYSEVILLSMDLRQRLSALTKLAPERQTSPSRLAPLYPEQGFALPRLEEPKDEQLEELSRLADPCLLPELRSFAWEQVAFVDTETTGLSTGVGTYVILLGIGSFRHGVFSVRQYFLPDPADESAFWQQALADLRQYPLLCTFNGRSYDLPLINNRLTMNGLPVLQPAAHLDLLYPARRLWRRVLPSCALQSLEQHRLDHKRVDDVPGALIPGMYHDYLQTGDSSPLQAIFEHNRRDIVSLFELTTQLAVNCASPGERFVRAEEFFGLAEAYLRGQQSEFAEEMINQGLAHPGDERIKRQYMHKLAKMQARAGRYEQAVHTWQELALLESLSPLPLIELSKLYEHRFRDLALARRAAEQALAICRRRSGLGVSVSSDEEKELAKRLSRLMRRLENQAKREEFGDGGGSAAGKGCAATDQGAAMLGEL